MSGIEAVIEPLDCGLHRRCKDWGSGALIGNGSLTTSGPETLTMPRITSNLRLALTKAAIVLFPSYGAAWLTGEMVYVVPTLAAAGFLASAVGEQDIEKLVDADVDTDVDVDTGEAGSS